MAEVSVNASLGVKLNLASKKDWGNYDNVHTNHSLTITRSYPEDLSDEELEHKAEQLHTRCQKFIETKVAQDMKDAKRAE